MYSSGANCDGQFQQSCGKGRGAGQDCHCYHVVIDISVYRRLARRMLIQRLVKRRIRAKMIRMITIRLSFRTKTVTIL